MDDVKKPALYAECGDAFEERQNCEKGEDHGAPCAEVKIWNKDLYVQREVVSAPHRDVCVRHNNIGAQHRDIFVQQRETSAQNQVTHPDDICAQQDKNSQRWSPLSKLRLMRLSFTIILALCVLQLLQLYRAQPLSFEYDYPVGATSSDPNTQLEAIRSAHDLPSLAALSVCDGVVKKTALGRRNYYAEPSVTTSDVFKLGSNGKAMTATLLAIVLESSFLTWDTPIGRALFLSGIEIHHDHAGTTLAMLAAHRSGITDPGPLGAPPLYERLYDPRLTPAEGRRLVAEAALTAPPTLSPGSAFAYSNTGYMLLGFVLEHLSRIPWEDLISLRLLLPLGMNSCGFGVSPMKSPYTIDNPWPHRPSPLGPVPVYPNRFGDVPMAMGPAGSIYCSMDDYAKFLQLHLDGYHGRSTRLMRKESFKKLHTSWPGQSYTCGAWNRAVDERVNGTLMAHSGSNTLNYVTAWLAPEIDSAFVGFTNVGGDDGAGLATLEIVEMLANRTLLL